MNDVEIVSHARASKVTMRRFAWMAGVLLACASQPASRTETPTSAETSPATGEGTPKTEGEASHSGELAGALHREGVLACARACARLASCASQETTDDCHDDCVDVLLAGHQAAPAVRYAACVDGLSCEQIVKSMGMGMGPVGLCYVEAQRMAR